MPVLFCLWLRFSVGKAKPLFCQAEVKFVNSYSMLLMDEPPSYLLSLTVVILLFFVHGCFVCLQCALVLARPRLNSNGFRGPAKSVARAKLLLEEIESSVSAAQFTSVTTALLLGWYGISLIRMVVIGFFVSQAEVFSKSSPWLESVAISVAFVVVAFVHLLFAELFAKAIAVRYPVEVVVKMSGVLSLVRRLLRPLIGLFSGMVGILLRGFGMDPNVTPFRLRTAEELVAIFSYRGEKHELDQDEERMIQGVVSFSDMVAREVMTPRTDIISIPASSTLDEAVAIVRESGYSRFPVTGINQDDIAGLVLAKDLLAFLANLHQGRAEEFSVEKLMREAYFIPSTKSVDDLLAEFKRRKVHMAVVLDEHGGVDGVVTLEDLIEKIVGDIFDESDEAERYIQPLDNGDVLLDGGLLVEEVNDHFHLQIPEGEYDTIAGFIFSSLGRMPSADDELYLDQDGKPVIGELLTGHNGNGASQSEQAPSLHARFTVHAITGHRIDQVCLTILDARSHESGDEVVGS